jgi:hypothetical protein
VHLTRTWTGAKLALATVAVSCLALLLPPATANAAPAADLGHSSATSALLQATGLKTVPAGNKPTIVVTRSDKAPGAAGANLAVNPLTIFVTNFTTTSFDAVNLGVFRNSTPGLQVFSQGPLEPLSLIFFQVDNCTDVRQYALQIVDNGAIVARSGDVTPDASDGDLCSDIFDIG